MDDPLLVSGFQRFGDLQGNGKSFLQRNRTPGDPLGEVFAFHQFHHQCSLTVGFLQPVDGGNVGVTERGQDLRLAAESTHSLAVTGKGFRQHLQGHFPVQPGVRGPVHLTHSTLSDLFRNAVMGDGLPDQQHRDFLKYVM